MSPPPFDPAAQLAGIREETRFELKLLHERVNTLLAAEAFLTIAYTATMNSLGFWGMSVRQLARLLEPWPQQRSAEAVLELLFVKRERLDLWPVAAWLEAP